MFLCFGFAVTLWTTPKMVNVQRLDTPRIPWTFGQCFAAVHFPGKIKNKIVSNFWGGYFVSDNPNDFWGVTF
jgi:hypothetical protein